MKVDLSKVDKVMLYDKDGNVVDTFTLEKVELISSNFSGRILKLKKE